MIYLKPLSLLSCILLNTFWLVAQNSVSVRLHDSNYVSKAQHEKDIISLKLNLSNSERDSLLGITKNFLYQVLRLNDQNLKVDERGKQLKALETEYDRQISGLVTNNQYKIYKDEKDKNITKTKNFVDSLNKKTNNP